MIKLLRSQISVLISFTHGPDDLNTINLEPKNEAAYVLIFQRLSGLRIAL